MLWATQFLDYKLHSMHINKTMVEGHKIEEYTVVSFGFGAEPTLSSFARGQTAAKYDVWCPDRIRISYFKAVFLKVGIRTGGSWRFMFEA
jgi:hypothetical protein